MSFHLVINDLLRFNPSDDQARTGITRSDILRWSEALSCTRAEVYELIAIYLAHEYHNFSLSFAFCDGIVNDIWGLIIELDGAVAPDLFWRVYEAFDQGEYWHDDNREMVPESTFTRPMISEIVSKYPLSLFESLDC